MYMETINLVDYIPKERKGLPIRHLLSICL